MKIESNKVSVKIINEENGEELLSAEVDTIHLDYVKAKDSEVSDVVINFVNGSKIEYNNGVVTSRSSVAWRNNR